MVLLSIVKAGIPLRLSILPRCYCVMTKGAEIRSKFQSKADIADFFEDNTWDGHTLLKPEEHTASAMDTTEVPSDETIHKLLKLSGLSRKGVDMEKTRATLANQIKFINILQSIELTDKESKYDTTDARLIPRNSKPLKYDDLVGLVDAQKNGKQGSEIAGSWNPTSLASKTSNNYFVLEKGLLKNRK